MAANKAKKRLTHDDYTVGLIYVKPLEMSAIVTMLDEEHEKLRLNDKDQNSYRLGKIGDHNVIVVGPPRGEQGKVAISTVVNHIPHSFKNVKLGLLVGIGGGVPNHDHDIRLGDVVVGAPEEGPAVVQYDLGRFNTEGIIEVKGRLGKPPPLLLGVVSDVDDQYQRLMDGATASAFAKRNRNTLRDQLSAQHDNALCFEMEAAGLMDQFPCLVIRGICDYSDSHKNDEWQRYAAANAAAYAREILYNMPERVAVELKPSMANADNREVVEKRAEETERLEFLQMLSFSEMNNRKTSVESAYTHTYEWVQDSAKYQDWKASKGGKLLIKGKAGCGKSTLMKHLYSKERHPQPGLVVCGFFFNNLGTPFERSTEAMLRTLIHEIVFQHPESFKDLQRFYSDRKSREAAQKKEINWTRDQLEQMFTTLTGSPHLSGLIYIDALDEGEGFLPSKIFGFLEKQLGGPDGSYRDLRICLSSRPSNFVDRRTAWTTIDLGTENSRDIEVYTTRELQEIADSCSYYKDMIPKLCEEIMRKADGIFLWAKIVVERLQGSMVRLESEDEIWDTLEDSPNDLYKLFITCLKRVEKKFQDRMVQILQIVLVAERPLSIDELVDLMTAVNSSATTRPGKSCRTKSMITVEGERDQMKRNIQNWCGGLVEVIETPRTIGIRTKGYSSFWYEYNLSTEIRFMHQSVKEFLRESTELNTLGFVEVEATSQRLLFIWCLRYLEHLESLKFHESGIGGSAMAHWEHISQEHPFLIYSPFWIKHAENCDPKNLDRDKIRRLNGAFEAWFQYPPDHLYAGSMHPRTLYTSIYSCGYREHNRIYSSLLAFSANRCFINLVEALLLCPDIDYEQEKLDMALISACNWSLEYERPTVYGSDILRSYPWLDSKGQVLGVSKADWLAREAVVDLLIKKGADVNVRGRDEFGQFGTPVTAACWWGRLKIVETLIKTGADVNLIHPDVDCDPASKFAMDSSYATPLIAACWGGNISVAKFLIRHGAQVDIRAGRIGTALAEAACKGDIKMIGLLLNSHASIDMLLDRDHRGTALTMAAAAGKEEAVKYLVARGAKVNVGCREGSPLSAAASCSEENGAAIMEYLINNGASVKDLQEDDKYGSILLSTLCEERVSEKNIPRRIRLLVRHGINVNVKFKEGKYATALIAAACRHGEDSPNDGTQIMLHLIGHGARVNEQPTVGEYGSALIAAVMNGHYGRVEFLIKNGADVNLSARTGKYESALEAVISEEPLEWHGGWRREERLLKTIDILLRNGADPDNVLLAHAESYRPELLEHLVSHVKDEVLRRRFSEDTTMEDIYSEAYVPFPNSLNDEQYMWDSDEEMPGIN
ncbi:uncharacterized protein DFL_009396 [Arthrobotrys flagrans]|uniref:Nephrocystin 3-like N-terminal domain-containing protein n=1 Tax=Arthrobotrys flagrans TaxID=97331 RepID=A0A436ZS05_ARTFL|nr:hypothetical protein DFL_009396 [Arthrobotrys flagrans]